MVAFFFFFFFFNDEIESINPYSLLTIMCTFTPTISWVHRLELSDSIYRPILPHNPQSSCWLKQIYILYRSNVLFNIQIG